ncbi:MAG: Ig-like domain-containing protein [Spirochaetes bacterium]|nr:Ig-like domain-containing protein [Spirochaetota bacterium]
MRHLHYIVHCVIAASLLAVPSCKESPTTIALDLFTSTVSNPPGYWYPTATVIPDTATTLPIDSNIVIIFSIPVTEASVLTNVDVTIGGLPVAHSILTNDPLTTIATIEFAAPLPPLTAVTVTLTGGIVDVDNSVPLNNPGNFVFTTGTEPDTTPPTFVGGTNNPTNPPLVELTDTARLAAAPPQAIRIDFSEDIDPNTLNGTTFYLDDGTDVIAATIAYNAGTDRATLTPAVNLTESTTYTVTVTTGVRDLSGNPLAAGTSWTFDTVADPYDPYGFLPLITEGPLVEHVDTDSALLTWITNKPTDYTLHYGRGDDTASTSVETLFASLNVFEFSDVPITLDTNARYWFNVEFGDIVGNSGTSATRQFNTESGETPDVVQNGAGAQHTAHRLEHTAASPTGSFIFWTNNSGTWNNLYGQLYNSAFAEQWNGGTPQGLFTETSNYTYESAAEDGTGGVIVMALRSGDSRVYAKRLDDSGASPWGHAAGDTGTQVRAAAISDVSAVPVTTGTVTPVASGTVEMGSLALSNPFFDDDVDLSVLATGDIVMDPVTHDGTTLQAGALQNFDYIIGQAANTITPTDAYVIGSGTDSVAITAQDHQIRRIDPPGSWDYLSGSATVYTPHDYTLPLGWTLDAGDIISSAGNYGLLNAVTLQTPITVFDSGTDDGGGGNSHLLDSTKAWGPLVGEIDVRAGDWVVNEANSLFTQILSVANFDLTLDAPPPAMGFAINDPYSIYTRYCLDHIGDLTQFEPFYDFTIDWNMGITSGSNFTIHDYTGPTGTAQAIPGNPLLDNEGNFNAAGPAPLPVAVGDVVINYTDDTFAAVSSAAYTHAMGLDANIMADGDVYEVVRIPSGGTGDIVSVGTTTGTTGGHLIDTSGGKNFITDGVSAGDRAYNLTDGTYATITDVAAQDLTLDTDIFTAGERYIILQSGLLFIFQEGTNVRGRIMSMGGGGSPPVEITAAWTIYAGINPAAISDGSGNALVVYEDASALRQVRTALLNGRGVPQWNTEIDTQAAVAESIVGVKSDGVNGVVILYRYGDDLHAQRIDSTGARLWGVSGIAFDNDGATTVTSEESWEYIAPNDVIVAAKAANNIWAMRASFGATGWAAPVTYTALGSTQEAPQLFLNGANTIILWEDNRFDNPPSGYIDTGWGVFGLKIDATDGAINVGWYANTSGANDTNGVSIILNSYNYLPPNPLVVPFNDGAGARLVWEDYRAGTANDLLSIDLVSFTP